MKLSAAVTLLRLLNSRPEGALTTTQIARKWLDETGSEINLRSVQRYLSELSADSADGPALANDNEIAWDGRDADGDPVANGVYLYKLEIQTSEGKTISRVERMARAR